MPSIILGATYVDVVTNFVGVAIAHTQYLGGSGRSHLQSHADRPGQRPASEWFEDGRLQQLKVEPVVQLEPTLDLHQLVNVSGTPDDLSRIAQQIGSKLPPTYHG